MINVAIAEGHRMVSQGFEALIEQSGIAHVVCRALSIAECESMLGEHPSLDVLLLDIGMPDGNSLDHVEMWKAGYPTLRILILSAIAEPAVIVRALASGAEGYVLTTADSTQLIEGIETIAHGEHYVCPEASEILKRCPQTDVVELTPREREVLRLIAEGYSIKMIADRLCLAFETVHSYFKYLKLKLGVNNTAALVRKAIEQHLL